MIEGCIRQQQSAASIAHRMQETHITADMEPAGLKQEQGHHVCPLLDENT
jgi:hypothetical protein